MAEVIRHFELEEIPIRVRHPESNGRIERYHHSVRDEAFADREVGELYRAKDLLEKRGEVLQRAAAALRFKLPAPSGLLLRQPGDPIWLNGGESSRQQPLDERR